MYQLSKNILLYIYRLASALLQSILNSISWKIKLLNLGNNFKCEMKQIKYWNAILGFLRNINDFFYLQPCVVAKMMSKLSRYPKKYYVTHAFR